MARKDCKTISPLTQKQMTRFWAKVERHEPDECWPWTAFVDQRGYGLFTIGPPKLPQQFRASRLAYFLAYHIDPGNLFVCHHCDNPACCNPAHLFAATHRINMLDAMTKGRMAQGEKNAGAKLTETDVAAIRALYASGSTSYTKIGKQFGVSKTMIGFIVQRQNWNHV
jgi:hypothetical protein